MEKVRENEENVGERDVVEEEVIVKEEEKVSEDEKVKEGNENIVVEDKGVDDEGEKKKEKRRMRIF